VQRFYTLEMMHDHAIHAQSVRYVEDVFGRAIPTHDTLYLYLRQIERIIALYNNTHFFNLCSQGAHIRGSQELQLVEELDAILEKKLLDKTYTLNTHAIDLPMKDAIMRALEG